MILLQNSRRKAIGQDFNNILKMKFVKYLSYIFFQMVIEIDRNIFFYTKI